MLIWSDQWIHLIEIFKMGLWYMVFRREFIKLWFLHKGVRIEFEMCLTTKFILIVLSYWMHDFTSNLYMVTESIALLNVVWTMETLSSFWEKQIIYCRFEHVFIKLWKHKMFWKHLSENENFHWNIICSRSVLRSFLTLKCLENIMF